MAAISAVGFGVALLPFVSGPPPHLSDLKIDMRPVHHYRSDNNQKDHMHDQNLDYANTMSKQDENSNVMPLTKYVDYLDKEPI